MNFKLKKNVLKTKNPVKTFFTGLFYIKKANLQIPFFENILMMFLMTYNYIS